MEQLKNWKTYVFILMDIVLINISYRAALYFRFIDDIPVQYLMNYQKSIAVIILIYLAAFYIFKLYNSFWSYASVDEYILILGSCIIANLSAIVFGWISDLALPFSVNVLSGILSIFLIAGFRMSLRVYARFLAYSGVDRRNYTRVMVVGAGSTGLLMIKEMRHHKEMNYKPVALIDDNKSKIGTTIAGVNVLGNRYQIEMIAKNKCIDIILIAIPTIDIDNKREIIDICKRTGCKTKIMPGINELIDSNISINKVRDVNVEDLLGRDPVKLDMDGISDYIKGRSILVTGGGGSIGSELCRQIARFKPKKLVILDIYENNAYDLQNELRYDFPDLRLKVIIASVRDRKRLDSIFEKLKPDVVFHAAAHKHVPLMEDNPSEAIKNNIFGTLNAAECSDKYGVKRFVLISTDKAVNPTNVMGATKRVCEMIVQAMDRISVTQFVAVRFGNVLGSNGSVVPLFKKQITQGGPVTVTHKDITRFFMTIPEAAQLVLQAGAFAKGGEIFVLDMGQPVKIYDLACDLIKLSGLEPNKDIKIEITGLRPGEKLYEEVLMAEEGLSKTVHNKIFVGSPIFYDLDNLKEKLEVLWLAVEEDDNSIMVKKLEELVPTYNKVIYEEVASTLS